MLQHYIRIALRNLGKLKILTFINVFGLSVGLACCTLFLLYSVSEFSYDRFHQSADRTFRVNQVWKNGEGNEMGMAGLYMPLGPTLKKDFPDVEDYVRIAGSGDAIIRVNDQLTRIPVAHADPGFFSFFNFPLLTGRDPNVLKDPHNVVLTRDRAMQLFGSINIVGRRLEIKSDTTFEPFTVTGVAENCPPNSSIRFDIMGSYAFLLGLEDRKAAINSWSMTNGDETYVRLKPGSRLASEPDRLLQFRFKYYPDERDSYHKTKKIEATFALQPIRTLHTTTNIDAGDPANQTDPKNIWILLGVAGGILLIASINFTTLAIARSAGRAREVGVRKVIGGRRYQLVLQFLTESLLVTIVSAALGLLLAYAFLPYFNQLSGRQLSFSFGLYPELGRMLIGLVLLVGLLAGSYPALVLSGFNPVEVLKAKIRLGGANIFTRSLVTFQFVIAIGLIIATVVILQQMSYMRNRDIGLIKENTIVVNANDADTRKIYPLLTQTLRSRKDIIAVGASSMGMGEGEGQMGGRFDFDGKMDGVIMYPIDSSFIPALGMQLVAGRNFNGSISADSSSAVIVNETLLRNDMGLSPGEAIGKTFKGGRNKKLYTIIGVVKDFNFEPLTRQVRPQLFVMPSDLQPTNWYVRVHTGQTASALAAIGEAWHRAVPDLPFRYSFLDERIDHFYKAEQRWMNILGWAGGISIFLACLGLFGLAALAAVNRIREIGIRKILGASVAGIVQLLAIGFVRLVLLAALIASPLAWYFMHRWLEHFAYRIDMGWWVFALTAFAAVIIAVLTIAIQAIRAATINPVKNLRTE